MNNAARTLETLTIRREDALTAADVVQLLPFVSTPVTITRWMRVGYRGVRLRGVRYGSKWATTRALVDEFVEKINALHDAERLPLATNATPPPTGAAPTATPASRSARSNEKRKKANAVAAERRAGYRRADARLRKAGV